MPPVIDDFWLLVQPSDQRASTHSSVGIEEEVAHGMRPSGHFGDSFGKIAYFKS